MKKCISLVLIIVLILFTGCGENKNKISYAETRTITDSAGRTVEIPSVVNKIVALGNTPRMVTYLGLADKVVGIASMALDRITPVTAYAYANKDLWKEVPIVGTDAAGATDYYPEQIISVQPDVILCSYTKELGDEIQTKTGIPVIVVPMGTLFGKDYEEGLLLLGDVCGVKDRAAEVISYINNALKDLKDRTFEVPETSKAAVLGAAATFKGAHGIEGVYAKYAVFEAISANDVTKDIAGAAGAVIIDKEQILRWDPQYIFFDSGGVHLVHIDYKKNSGFYKHLKAVNNDNLYQYPSSTSYYSNVEISIANCYYAGSLLYKEQFKDINFEEKANEIFKFFLGADDYISKLKSSGAGYNKVILGDS